MKKHSRHILALGLATRDKIPAGGSHAVTSRVQVPFHPFGLLIPQYYADAFLIEAIIVGNRCVVQASADALPADMFSVRIEDMESCNIMFGDGTAVKIDIDRPASLIHGREFYFPLMHPGTDVSIRLQNVSPIEWPFRGALIGYSPDE